MKQKLESISLYTYLRKYYFFKYVFVIFISKKNINKSMLYLIENGNEQK